jgi:hypothetical protein
VKRKDQGESFANLLLVGPLVNGIFYHVLDHREHLKPRYYRLSPETVCLTQLSPQQTQFH